MQTSKYVDNIRYKVRWKLFLMSKLRTNSAWVGEDESEQYVRICSFKDSAEIFPDVKAEKAIVGKTYIADGGFVFFGG